MVNFKLHCIIFLIVPTLTGPVANATVIALNNPVIIGCLADGVPPDKFFLSKDDVVINSNYIVQIANEAQYSAIIQHNITSLQEADYGVYTCIYASPIQTISSPLRLSGELIEINCNCT